MYAADAARLRTKFKAGAKAGAMQGPHVFSLDEPHVDESPPPPLPRRLPHVPLERPAEARLRPVAHTLRRSGGVFGHHLTPMTAKLTDVLSDNRDATGAGRKGHLFALP